MTDVATSVANIRASIKTMQTYLDNVDTWYSTYTSAHSETYCKNLNNTLSWGEDIKTAKLAVENVILKVDDYLDDTAWIAKLREHKTKWSKAERECATADTEVVNNKLRAQESWRGSAGNAYRTAVTAQQGAIASAERAAGVMTNGCENGAYHGENYFAALDAALKDCVAGLPTSADFPPWSGDWGPERNPQGQTAYDHEKPRLENTCDNHATKTGKTASSTCRTAVDTAMTEFVESFTDAFKTFPDNVYVYSTARPNLSIKDVVGTWPKAPGQS